MRRIIKNKFLSYIAVILWMALIFKLSSQPAVESWKVSGDEFHQAFVPGRGPGVRDVFIDSAGALVGILIYLGIKKKLDWRE